MTGDAGGEDCAGIAAALRDQGWSVHPGFLSPDESRDLLSQATTLHASGAFRSAAVGHGRGRVANTAIRSDEIHWIEPAQSTDATAGLLARMEALRLCLNELCLLGLFDLEMHFARYPVGSRYARHLDRFRDDSARVLSCVLYLNEAWSADDGGQLRLYTAPDISVDVLPAAGTLVTFLSDRFPHEVLPARRERWSVTGWFRARAS